MITQIFKTCEDFLNRRDLRINGVSEEFAKDHPDFEKDNKSNTGCWNCIDCIDCTYCIDCFHCSDCRGCIDCIDCRDCIDCSGASGCSNRKGCRDLIEE